MGGLRILFISIALVSAYLHANAAPSEQVIKKVLQQGVPAEAFDQMLRFMEENKGRSFQQEIYTCDGQDRDNVKPCEESKRNKSSTHVTLGNPTFVAIVDYSAPSTKRRFFLINLKSGEVKAFYTSHGIGSGKGNYAYKFSNTKDSRQTSLGMYLTGDTYRGSYGPTLRMYGLERSNDQAYNRDIVLHGAWYVGEDFIKTINPKTKEPFGRLGLSWGCPAVSLSVVEKIAPLLKNGSLVLHYHGKLQERALSGLEVRLDDPTNVTPVTESDDSSGEQGS